LRGKGLSEIPGKKKLSAEETDSKKKEKFVCAKGGNKTKWTLSEGMDDQIPLQGGGGEE